MWMKDIRKHEKKWGLHKPKGEALPISRKWKSKNQTIWIFYTFQVFQDLPSRNNIAAI